MHFCRSILFCIFLASCNNTTGDTRPYTKQASTSNASTIVTTENQIDALQSQIRGLLDTAANFQTSENSGQFCNLIANQAALTVRSLSKEQLEELIERKTFSKAKNRENKIKENTKKEEEKSGNNEKSKFLELMPWGVIVIGGIGLYGQKHYTETLRKNPAYANILDSTKTQTKRGSILLLSAMGFSALLIYEGDEPQDYQLIGLAATFIGLALHNSLTTFEIKDPVLKDFYSEYDANRRIVVSDAVRAKNPDFDDARIKIETDKILEYGKGNPLDITKLNELDIEEIRAGEKGPKKLAALLENETIKNAELEKLKVKKKAQDIELVNKNKRSTKSKVFGTAVWTGGAIAILSELSLTELSLTGDECAESREFIKKMNQYYQYFAEYEAKNN